METNQPIALRLVEQYDNCPPLADCYTWKNAVCSELRRQHAEIETLRKTNTAARGTDAQIIKERELCAYAFAGAVADGLSCGTGPDTQESEWLRPAFEAGQEIAQLRTEIDKLRKRECLHQIGEPAPSELDVRGRLAASLTCWHRLTGQEAAELVALFQGRAAQAAARDATWLTTEGRAHGFRVMQDIHGAVITHSTDSLSAAIDAAIAAQGGV